MTVKQLIEQLQKMNPDLTVTVRGEVCGSDQIEFKDIEAVEYDEMVDWEDINNLRSFKTVVLETGTW